MVEFIPANSGDIYYSPSAVSLPPGGEVMPPVKVLVITVVMFAICQLIAASGMGIW